MMTVVAKHEFSIGHKILWARARRASTGEHAVGGKHKIEEVVDVFLLFNVAV